MTREALIEELMKLPHGAEVRIVDQGCGCCAGADQEEIVIESPEERHRLYQDDDREWWLLK